SVKADEMLREASELIKIADNITIKLPTIREGVIACKRLSSQGVKVNIYSGKSGESVKASQD
ncbi:MAG: hypothetical protein IKG61_00990, partial [Selenomonadaceae bacterium]|nr:hypothetical protein [Selenomonadaceae bacterium]